MYQFYHFETYPLHSTKSKKAFSQITKEFMRNPVAIPHVENPKSPVIRYGVDAYAAEQIIKERIEKAKDKMGRKIRKDAQVCVSSVVSFPSELAQDNQPFYENWVSKNIDYFKAKYGENLLSVIEHLDEEHPHLHIIVSVPNSTEFGGAAIGTIHEPIRRRDEQKGSKAKVVAFSEAAREMQDDYFNQVSVKFGLLRTGPKRKRLTRKEYVTAKREALLLAQSIRKNENQKISLTIQAKKIEAKQSKLSTLESSVKKNAQQVIKQKESLRKREAIANEREENIDAQEKLLLTFLDDNPEPNKAKNFYSKMVASLKLKLDEYIKLFKEYRKKYNSLTVKYKRLEQSHTEEKIKNGRLEKENRKLRIALQVYKESASIVVNEMEYTP